MKAINCIAIANIDVFAYNLVRLKGVRKKKREGVCRVIADSKESRSHIALKEATKKENDEEKRRIKMQELLLTGDDY